MEVSRLSFQPLNIKPKKGPEEPDRTFKHIIYEIVVWLFSPVYLGILFFVSILVRLQKKDRSSKPRFVWGPAGLMSNVYWSRAMRLAGYPSETYVNEVFVHIHKTENFDKILRDKYKFLPLIQLKFFLAFIESLFKYDIFVIPFCGSFLGFTPLWRFEAFALRLAKKKTVVIPFGYDMYVYRNIRSMTLLHGMMISYPKVSRKQEKIYKQVAYWCRHGDVVIPGFMGIDGLGRWDVLIPTFLFLDESEWTASRRLSEADGVTGTVYVSHAPNHRGIKGSEFIFKAVETLQKEGLKVELILMEKIQNDQVRKILNEDTDILVEEIIFVGHGFNGLEGLASGLPTINNLENDHDSYVLPFRRWSYFNECPLVSASPETITDVLRKLVTRPELRHQLGKAGRDYVEKYHGLESAQYLFGEVVEYLNGNRESLINLYHPILGEYSKRKPKVEHPLVNNQIIG